MKRKADPETMQRNALQVRGEINQEIRERNARQVTQELMQEMWAAAEKEAHPTLRDRIIRAIRNYLHI